jgi:hypothetical protein
LKLRGGMFDEGQIEVMEVENDFLDDFMFGEDFVLTELQRFPLVNPAPIVNVFRFETNEAVNEYIRLEQIRLTRENTRFDEEIQRNDNIICIEANIN